MKKLLVSLMPGLFLIGYNIGTGSLTAMSKAGANYGCDLLWAVLLSCLITWYLINFSRVVKLIVFGGVLWWREASTTACGETPQPRFGAKLV